MRTGPILAITGLCGLVSAAPASGVDVTRNESLIIYDRDFPRDEVVHAQALFMAEIYLRVDDDEALIFDPEHPTLVFARLPLRRLDRLAAKDSIERHRMELRRRLAALYRPGAHWDGADSALDALFPRDWTPAERLLSVQRSAAKKGLRRTFRKSLSRSYRYLPMAEAALREHGLPMRLKYLPHVESRFHNRAVSHAGAVGLWQILASTGKAYLEINSHVDQRLDPEAAARAAAKLLRTYHRHLRSWPLAVLAYNAGIAEILRAIREQGYTDAGQVVRHYRSPAFRRFSKLYYAKFLAASSLAMQAKRLYPGLRRAEPLSLNALELRHAWTPMQLRLMTGYSLRTLRECNPELNPVVFERNLRLPRGFGLRLPRQPPSSEELAFDDVEADPDKAHAPEMLAGLGNAGLPGQGFMKTMVLGLRRVLLSEHHQGRERRLFLKRHGMLDPALPRRAAEDGLLLNPHPYLSERLKAGRGK